MRKIKWDIQHPEFGSQGVIVANTRLDAIAKAQANHLAQNASYGEFNPHTPIPAFTAIKVINLTGRHFDFDFESGE